MADTFFVVPPDKQRRMVKTFQRNADGSLVEPPPRPTTTVEFFSGGGGLFSTAQDYLTFSRAIMAGGELGGRRILSKASIEAMGRNQIGELTIGPFTSLVPQLMVPHVELSGIDKFGLGFALNSRPLPGGRGANTMSWAGIFNTFFWIDREKQIAAVFMTQMLPFMDPGAATTIGEFDRAVYAWRNP
jgi:CubicO group peptidase (beta-lactamase class C family)